MTIVSSVLSVTQNQRVTIGCVLHCGREQAAAIGQALLYAGYIEPIGNQLPIFRDDFTLYKQGEVSFVEFLALSEHEITTPEPTELFSTLERTS